MKLGFDQTTYRITRVRPVLMAKGIGGAVGLAFCLVAYLQDSKQFFFSYLTAFSFVLSMGLGGMFFTMLHHAVAAKWSVVLRRVSETLMSLVPWMFIFFLPILLFGIHDLYPWSHVEHVAHDSILQKKVAYLNVPFWIVRSLLYFLIWTLLARFFYKTSLAQDEAFDEKRAEKMTKWAPLGLILFAFTVTFASIDWIMSLDPHWFSTMFGVYFFAGSFMSGLAFILLVVLYFRYSGALTNVISSEHLHDLGKLMFAFMAFWAYVAFSQYMLIWYGNIPEETVWYLHRSHGSWGILFLFVGLFHFVLPFLILLPREIKRNPIVLWVMAPWLIVIHWVDLYWVVMPNLHPHGIHFSWVDVAAYVALSGSFAGLFWWKMSKHAVIPIHDPNLKASKESVS